MSSAATAEAVKLTENIFRAVNIALVNELKVVYAAMGIDVWEVIDAAKTKPFGFMPFYPGPGLGGHCIPIDPFYLTWKAREYDIATRFIELAGEINTRMPYYVVDKLVEAVDQQGGQGARRRDDPAPRHRLQEERRRHAREPLAQAHRADRGAGRAASTITIPTFPVIPLTREHAAACGPQVGRARRPRRSQPTMPCSSRPTMTMSTTSSSSKHASVVVDTRNACARAGHRGGPHRQGVK